MTQKKKALEYTLGKGENAGYQHFLKVFSTLSKREIIILAPFNLSYASAFNSRPESCRLVKGYGK